MSARCPAVLITAAASGQGKTTVTAALARLHARAGRRVRVFKCGPDFLDPFWHQAASGSPVHQLDLWMTGEQDVRARLHAAAQEADLILIEGVMGLFDGAPSAADLAERLDLPVLAVVDASAMAGTFGALALGLQQYRPGLLACAFVTVPALSLRHFRAVERGARELERSAYLATHDLLTGLPNRFLFMDRFEQAVQQHIRNGNSFALLLLDLDHFKEINDQYGHEVGDAVLVESARRMTGEIRACDTVARHGGDEFVVLLANTLDSNDALAVAEKLRHAIAQPLESADRRLSITPSIGVAMYPADGKTLDDLRRAADEAMYEAKKNGRNAVSGFRQAAG